jgi:AbiV family abortive infection protein
MAVEKLNLRRLQQIAGLALQNGIRLHFDSITLYKAKAFPSAFFISVIAMEEMGKAFWADHFVFSSKANGRTNTEFEAEWINALFGDHKMKQISFLNQVFSKVDKKFYRFVDSKQLDIMKQNAIYIGLTKPPKDQPRTKGKTINPLNLKREEAKAQIQMLQFFLLEEIEGIEDDIIYHDLAIFRKIFSNGLRLKILKHKVI